MVNKIGATSSVNIENISKTYGTKCVVDDVSFSVQSGEIFGLIGPNGAGKTTTIRMMMDIIKPDSGQISVLGEILSEETKNKIGYLPEERGLYKKLSIIDTLVYLASLKTSSGINVHKRAEELLEKVGMIAHKNKKIEELSKGMSQLIQLLATIIHDPDLIIFDEPFSGLDPVNTELIKNLILELKASGKTLILSTHQMNQVEALCDRIFMINRGKGVLYGKLSDIKKKYRNNSLIVETDSEIGELEGVSGRKEHNNHIELFLESGVKPQEVLKQLIGQNVAVSKFEVATPALHEIFIQVAGEEIDE